MPAQKQASQRIEWKGFMSAPPEKQLTADSFWNMGESVFFNGVAPGRWTATYVYQ